MEKATIKSDRIEAYMKTNLKRRIISLLIILLVPVLSAASGILIRRTLVDIRKQEADSALHHYSRNITLQLQGTLNEADSLAQMAQVMGDEPGWFQKAAAPLLEREEVRFICLFQGDTTVAALPEDIYGNLAGRDLKDYSYVYTLAKVVKELVVEGPVTLDFSDDMEEVFLFLQPIVNEGAYMGETVVALDCDYVLRQLDFTSLTAQGYDYELWRVNPQNGAKEVIAVSQPDMDFSSAAKTAFYLPTQWNLSIQPISGWVSKDQNIWISTLCVLGTLLLLILAGSLRRVLIQRHTIKQMDLTDRQTGFGNRTGFTVSLDKWLAEGSPFLLYYFAFEGYDQISQLIGPDNETAFLKSIPVRLEKYIRRPYLAGRLGSGCFALAVREDMDESQREDFAKGLSLELLLKVRLNGERNFLTARYHYIRCEPGKIQACDAITMLIHGYYSRVSQESPARMLTAKCRQLIEGQTNVTFEEYTNLEMLELSKTFNQYRKQVEQLAYFDPVFNVGNRPKFLRDINMLISYDKKRPFSLFCVDICAFSQYNELFSAEVGDSILQEVIRRMERPFGSYLYRINGDVFVGISLSAEGADLIADRLQRILTSPISVGNTAFTLQVWITACQYPVHGNSPVALLDCIQSALRFAKESGQKVILYNGELSRMIRMEAKILHRLKQSILENTLEVWYQPIVYLKTGRFFSAEALVRLPDENGGYFSAGHVISLAERNGMVEQLGEYVLKQAGQFMCSHARERGLLHMCINLSVQQLLVENSADHLLDLIRKFGIDPKHITLEITESVLIQSIEQTSAALSQLREAGIRIALDDFGVGYSSLNYLSNLPVDVIKIDRSLTKQVSTNKKQYALLRSIVEVAQINSLSVVAEGIETEEEKKLVADSGVHYIQGFYYSKPLPGDGLLRFLEEHRDD